MNKIISTLMLVYLFSCSEKYGFIYDEKSKKPLEGVLVADVTDLSKIFLTKLDGRFSFSDCNNLVIKKSGYKTDTLKKYGCKPNGKCFNGHIFYMKK